MYICDKSKPMRIDFKPIRMIRQKPTTVREAFCILEESYLYYKVDFDAETEQEDEAMPWVEERTYNLFTILRENVVGVDFYLSEFGKHYKVSIVTTVPSVDSPGIYFSLKDEKTALEVFNKISNWILKK